MTAKVTFGTRLSFRIPADGAELGRMLPCRAVQYVSLEAHLSEASNRMLSSHIAVMRTNVRRACVL